MSHLLAQELATEPGSTVTLAAHGAIGALPAPDERYRRLTIRAANGIERRFGLPLLLPHPRDLLALRRAVRQADVVIQHDCIYLAHLLALCSLRRGTRTIVVKHTGTIRFSSALGRALFGFLNRRVFPFFLRKADALVFVTEAKRNNFAPIEDMPAVVIPNGIDTELFAPLPDAHGDHFLFVGRFVDKKGVHVVRELARLLPQHRFVLAGFGPVDPRRWALANVDCHWSPDAATLARLYASARAVILPGETEGTPLVALEALACETPVLIGDSAAAPDPALARQLAMLPVDIDQPAETARYWAQRLEDAVEQSRPDRPAIVAAYGAGRMAHDYRTLIASLGSGPRNAGRQGSPGAD